MSRHTILFFIAICISSAFGAGQMFAVETADKQLQQTSIDCEGIKITTTDINNNRAVIKVSTPIISAEKRKIRMRTEIYNADYMVTSTSRTLKSATGSDRHDIEQTINLSWAHLWSPESPTIYLAKFVLFENEQVVDSCCHHFAIRIIETNDDGSVILNGLQRNLHGVIMPDNFNFLTSLHYDELRHSLNLLHDMGCDALFMDPDKITDTKELADSIGFILIDKSSNAAKEMPNYSDVVDLAVQPTKKYQFYRSKYKNLQSSEGNRHDESKAPFYMELIPRHSGKLTYIIVRVVDAKLCNNADNIVEIVTEGNGKFLAAINADETCTISHQSIRQKVFHGLLTVIVEGTPKITITSEGLETAEFMIENE